jgi:hypothetical protein
LLREQIDAPKGDVAMLEEDILTLKASEDPKSVVQPTDPDEIIRLLASNDRGELTSATKSQSKSSTAGGFLPTILPKTAPVYVWKSSASSISTGNTVSNRMMHVLDFPGVQVGTYTWKIKILHKFGVRLGVVVSSLELNYAKNLGTTEASGGYGGYGTVTPITMAAGWAGGTLDLAQDRSSHFDWISPEQER